MIDAATSLYEPLNQYKPFAHSIGIVDGPFEYMSLLGMRLPWPFTTRMTVVRLANGDLFLHSPIAFDAALAKRMQSMGVIKHLISPNKLHYAHIGEWALAFPNAVTWASPHVRSRARSQRISVNFNRDLAPGAPAEWRDEIDQILVPGGVFVQRTLQAGDVRAWAAAFGEVDMLAGPGASQGAACIVTAILTALVGSALPGPGTSIRTTSVEIKGPLPIGAAMTARLVVREKRSDQGIVVLDGQCTDPAGQVFATAILEVLAPTTRQRHQVA